MDIPVSSSCEIDSLTVYGNGSSGAEVSRICFGTILPGDIWLEGKYLIIQFVSGGNGNYTGFTVEVSTHTDRECE